MGVAFRLPISQRPYGSLYGCVVVVANHLYVVEQLAAPSAIASA